MLDSVFRPNDTLSLRGDIHLLVIDDDDVDRERYLRYLRSDERNNYLVTEATTAAAGAELLSNGAYDCVLLDYRLPDADGMALYQTFVSAEGGERVAPVIMTRRLIYASGGCGKGVRFISQCNRHPAGGS